MSVQDLKDIFEGFKKLRILVIGDVMIDSYLWGDVSRISPEAPVPIIAATSRENRLGGAANVALNVQALGAIPILCSVIGKDDNGEVLLNLLDKGGLVNEGMVTTSKRATTVKTRIISQNQHLLRVDEEIESPLNNELEERLFLRAERMLESYKIDAIIFEDYDKGVITPGLIEKVVTTAKEKGIPTLVDPKKRNFLDYKGVTFFKPNFKEFKEGLKLDIHKNQQDEMVTAATRFQKDQSIRMLMVTMAEKGVFIQSDSKHQFIPAEVRDISDVSGAGDTVISVSALCLASGMEPHLVARIANMAGGLVCESPGVVPVDKAKLIEECVDKKILSE
ncbi:D-glycero-beta-D-manno-heptose-7-phosphate kinase [Marinilabiliaceae bacterium JC017]|nr:D-glycero-beta-D-manno-heptose-7-phosphate kinase [Marinilabiliaceae bacterium JC017]